MSGTLFVVSAPSGAGKTSLLAAVLEKAKDIDVSVSYTTRSPRSLEEHGKSYFFISQTEFKQMQQQDSFLESADVFGNSYGTARDWVEARLKIDRDVVLEIDWQGALQVKEQFPAAVLIFILPPSIEHLVSRLKLRAQDTEEVQNLRLSKAKQEISKYRHFDYLVVNDDFKVATENLLSIFAASRLRLLSQESRLANILSELE